MAEQATTTSKRSRGFTAGGSPFLQRKCACGTHTIAGGQCDSCKKEKGSGSGNTLQRAAYGSGTSDEVPPIVNEVLRSPGQPLDAATRAFFEPRFGHDFSRVRVHTDARAAESASAVSALAYTVGRDMVFGAGQYQPWTSVGRRLLAHELTHVNQQEQPGGAATHAKPEIASHAAAAAEQEADTVARQVLERRSIQAGHSAHHPQRGFLAGMIQRTPAAPSLDGVTGVRDLSRLSIDAVSDIDTSKFILPQNVHPHVTDPDVVHIEWMLYYPDDKMVTGYTTQPNRPNSKSLPFVLKPSHFSGGGVLKGVKGKYLLRCTGLNAKHQPIVYSDRDITVVASDLKTGTDLSSTYGKLTFTKYGHKDAIPPSKIWEVNVEVKFMPDKKVDCDDVTYIQAVQTVDASGKSLMATGGPDIDARKTPLAWSIDQTEGVPSPYYIKGRDEASKVVDIADFGKVGKGGEKPKEATLADDPGFNRPVTNKFETCVMCRSGTNKGQVYGCATWGYSADASGKVTLQARSFRQTPSDQFKEALDAWNTWRAKAPKSSRPEEAPALKVPK